MLQKKKAKKDTEGKYIFFETDRYFFSYFILGAPRFVKKKTPSREHNIFIDSIPSLFHLSPQFKISTYRMLI